MLTPQLSSPVYSQMSEDYQLTAPPYTQMAGECQPTARA